MDPEGSEIRLQGWWSICWQNNKNKGNERWHDRDRGRSDWSHRSFDFDFETFSVDSIWSVWYGMDTIIEDISEVAVSVGYWERDSFHKHRSKRPVGLSWDNKPKDIKDENIISLIINSLTWSNLLVGKREKQQLPKEESNTVLRFLLVVDLLSSRRRSAS